MKFPHTPVGLGHSFGGEIVTIHRIGHRIDKPREGHSRDYWFLECDVRWKDTGKVDRHEVEPFKLTESTEGQPEVRALAEAMTTYLQANGTFDGTFKGRKVGGWLAYRHLKVPA